MKKSLIILVFGISSFFVSRLSQSEEWITVDSLNTLRAGHSSTLLETGKVLVSGGANDSSGELKSSEIFDPNTLTWSSSGNLNVSRSLHSATLLNNGKVLVSGGVSRNQQFIIINSCELFNPESGSWETANALNTERHSHTATLLNNGKVLVAGGSTNSGQTSTCEIYDPETGIWSVTGSMTNARTFHRAVRLESGKILVVGGENSNGRLDSCELYDPTTGIWNTTGKLAIKRFRHSIILLKTGKVLAVGGKADAPLDSCELYDPNSGIWTLAGSLPGVRWHHASSLLKNGNVLVMGGMGLGTSALSTCLIYYPEKNTWDNAPAMAQNRYRHTSTILKDNSILVVGGSDGVIITSVQLSSVEVFSLNATPNLTASASPTELKAGESVSFSTEASDPDGDSLTYSWDFGDGTDSSEQNPTHTYSTAGTYAAKVTVTDIAGNTASATITITVSKASDGGDGAGNPPTARFTTNTVVGFVNIPLAFDGTFSTDPENNIASYSWDFGDESPAGTEKTISKIYSSIGSYTVKLTVTDGEGLTNTASRQVEVLSEEDAGSFNAKVEFGTRLNFKKDNKDSFRLTANVNVGTQEVASGTTVKVEFAGNTFTGDLDTKLQDKSDKNEKWKVKANTTKQAAGEVLLKLKVKKASLTEGFQEAGVTAGDDPKEEIELELPIIITIGDRTIETTLDSTFKFNRKATKAKGSGELE